jgi:hypothetical protein
LFSLRIGWILIDFQQRGKSEWWDLQTALMTVLRMAVQLSSLDDEARMKFTVSVTEQEVLRTKSFAHNPSAEVRFWSICCDGVSFSVVNCCSCSALVF